jgi:hypothetical protein
VPRKVYLSPSNLTSEFFFPPQRGPSAGHSQIENEEHSLDDFSLEPTPVQSSRQSSRPKTTQSSNRSSNRSSRPTLFVQDDESDNDLGFDSS